MSERYEPLLERLLEALEGGEAVEPVLATAGRDAARLRHDARAMARLREVEIPPPPAAEASSRARLVPEVAHHGGPVDATLPSSHETWGPRAWLLVTLMLLCAVTARIGGPPCPSQGGRTWAR